MRILVIVLGLLTTGCIAMPLGPADSRIGLWSLSSDAGSTWFGIRSQGLGWRVQVPQNSTGSFDGMNLSLTIQETELFPRVASSSLASTSSVTFVGTYHMSQLFPFQGVYSVPATSGAIATGSWKANWSDW